VLRARPAEAEASLSLVGLGDLVGEVSRRARERLPDAPRHALAVALAEDEAGGPGRRLRAPPRRSREDSPARLLPREFGGAAPARPPARHLVLWSDVAPPTAPSTPDLATADDDGASNTDNVTSSTTLVLAGTAEPGATVTLFRDGASAGTARAGLANGEWSIADTVPGIGIGIGSYSYTASRPTAPATSRSCRARLVEVVAPPSAGGGGGGGGGRAPAAQPVTPVAATPAPVAAPLAPRRRRRRSGR
jgi:hypothetical protein